MRLLLDTCVRGGARGELAAAGHDAVRAGDWSVDPGDPEILTRAHADARIAGAIITAEPGRLRIRAPAGAGEK